MSTVITKGYLINKTDYELFDEVITFINEYGNIFTCLSLGSRKIISKNSQHLRYGCLLEFEFFQSRSIDKMGKLKKVVTVDRPSIEKDTNTLILFLNNIFFKCLINSKKGFFKYKEILDLIECDWQEDIIVIKILFETIFLTGSYMELNHCVFCKSKKIYSFSTKFMGFICMKCNDDVLKIDSSVIKIMFFIYKKKYNKVVNFTKHQKKMTINLLMFFIKENIGINLYSSLLSI